MDTSILYYYPRSLVLVLSVENSTFVAAYNLVELDVTFIIFIDGTNSVSPLVIKPSMIFPLTCFLYVINTFYTFGTGCI